MAEQRVQRRDRGGVEGGRERREGALLDLLRRVVAPRAPAVLVMEPDGRLVSARPARSGGRPPRSLG